jgi:hypothetical protein
MITNVILSLLLSKDDTAAIGRVQYRWFNIIKSEYSRFFPTTYPRAAAIAIEDILRICSFNFQTYSIKLVLYHSSFIIYLSIVLAFGFVCTRHFML